MQKPFFVGQRSLKILQSHAPRQVLVGIEIDPGAAMPTECHLVIDRGEIAGRITSVARSAALNKIVGLALVAPALAQSGVELSIRIDGGAMVRARVVPTPFYDPHNLRQKAPP